jgi:riboflavin synthase
MFTGIVEESGVVILLAHAQRSPPRAGQRRRSPTAGSPFPPADARLEVRTGLDLADTKVGDSIAVDGCCLTVVDLRPGVVAFDLGPETLAVTTLGQVVAGDRVHLERALRLSDRLGGHLVAGHVDAVGTVARVARELVPGLASAAHARSGGLDDGGLRAGGREALLVRVHAPPAITRYCVKKGSVCVDGVSLTLNAVDDDGFEVGLIPHTLALTSLATLAVGDRVNLEADLIGKYVEKLLVGRIAST